MDDHHDDDDDEDIADDDDEYACKGVQQPHAYSTHANTIRWLSTHNLFKTFGKSICCRFFLEASIEMRTNEQ